MLDIFDGLRRRGDGEYTADCPRCDYKRGLHLSLKGDVWLAFCHACQESWNPAHADSLSSKRVFPPNRLASTAKSEVDSRREAAQAIWGRALPLSDTPADLYLKNRAIDTSKLRSLRYAPDLLHLPSSERLPALIAAVVRNGSHEVCAIHRTYLTPDGRKAAVEPVRMSLGTLSGGAVRLAQSAPAMVIGEGIETTASAMSMLGMPGWAALSTNGLERLVLPEQVRRLTIAADRDRPGLASAARAAKRWRTEGRDVRIVVPEIGNDFNSAAMTANRDMQ